MTTNNPHTVQRAEQLSLAQGLAYGLPMVPITLLMMSLQVIQGIYSKHYGLSLTTISSVMFIAGLFDAITDPAIGYWSDRHHARTGNRHPFAIAGMILSIPCAWFLFVPEGTVTVSYFVFWYMAFYLAVTLFMIPHLAWGGELSTSSIERTRVMGFRLLGNNTGIIIYLIIPLLPFMASREITPETIRYSVLTSFLLILPCLYILLRVVPRGGPAPEALRRPDHPLQTIRALASNKPLLLFLAASLFFCLSLGMFYGVLFIVADAWLGLGEHFAGLYLFHLLVATLLIKPTVWLTNRMGKRFVWGVSILLGLCCLPIAMTLLHGGEHALILFYLLQLFLGLSNTTGAVAYLSLLPDIIDYDTLKTGRERSASYFSVQSFLAKLSSTTLGFPLGGAILGFYGFDPAHPTHTEKTLLGFQFAMGWIPAILFAFALVLVFIFPINTHRSNIIRRRLDSRMHKIKNPKTVCLNSQVLIDGQAVYNNT